MKELLLKLFEFMDEDIRLGNNVRIDDFISFRDVAKALKEIGEKELSEKVIEYDKTMGEDEETDALVEEITQSKAKYQKKMEESIPSKEVMDDIDKILSENKDRIPMTYEESKNKEFSFKASDVDKVTTEEVDENTFNVLVPRDIYPKVFKYIRHFFRCGKSYDVEEKVHVNIWGLVVGGKIKKYDMLTEKVICEL